MNNSFFSENSSRFYPKINIKRIETPNRWYALPILGGLFKVIILIPVFIELVILMGIGLLIVMFINSFIVLFTGKYWKTAYEYLVGVLRLYTKAIFYFQGLTDKYPGFGFNINDNYSYELAYPENPNRFYAIPLVGGIIRVILLIPYLILSQILGNASNWAMIFSFPPVLVKKYYPESTYELERDTIRISGAAYAYMAGISDTYPSFYISFNHKIIKILLIVLGVLNAFANYFNDFSK